MSNNVLAAVLRPPSCGQAAQAKRVPCWLWPDVTNVVCVPLGHRTRVLTWFPIVRDRQGLAQHAAKLQSTRQERP